MPSLEPCTQPDGSCEHLLPSDDMSSVASVLTTTTQAHGWYRGKAGPLRPVIMTLTHSVNTAAQASLVRNFSQITAPDPTQQSGQSVSASTSASRPVQHRPPRLSSSRIAVDIDLTNGRCLSWSIDTDLDQNNHPYLTVGFVVIPESDTETDE